MKGLFNKPSYKKKIDILVIEDNVDSWFLIRWALLRKFPEVEATWRRTDVETIAYLESCLNRQKPLPKLILLDLYLPSARIGWNLLEIIKTHHIFREIPVIILSNSDDKEDIRESYMFRANSYIVKPTNYEEWLRCFALFRQYWHTIVTLSEPV